MSMLHPHPDEHGKPVTIHAPSTPSPLSAWDDPAQIATVVPGGPLPASLDGVAFAAAPCPSDNAGPALDEPAYLLPPGLRPAAGAVIVETDGRVWLVAPTNRFGGYSATFPKGRLDPGAGLAATAVREAWEEAGLVIETTAFLADVRRTQTYTRYYLARRTGGTPAAMGWETQAVHLVPLDALATCAPHPNDAPVIEALRAVRSKPA